MELTACNPKNSNLKWEIYAQVRAMVYLIQNQLFLSPLLQLKGIWRYP